MLLPLHTRAANPGWPSTLLPARWGRQTNAPALPKPWLPGRVLGLVSALLCAFSAVAQPTIPAGQNIQVVAPSTARVTINLEATRSTTTNMALYDFTVRSVPTGDNIGTVYLGTTNVPPTVRAAGPTTTGNPPPADIGSSSAELSFVPNGTAGTLTFTFSARERRTNGAQAVSASSATGTFTINVVAAPTAVNDVVNNRSYTSAELIDVTANDAAGTSAINPASVQLIGTGTNGGAFSVNASGLVSFTAPASFSGASGTSSINYTVSDQSGRVSNQAALTVNYTNSAPVAANDAATRSFTATTSAINVLGNDTDADGATTLDPQGVDLVPGTAAVDAAFTDANGVAFTAGSTGTITFTNPNGYVGPSTLSYRVRDRAGLFSNAATLTLTLTSTAPTVVDRVNVALVPTAAATVLSPSLTGNDADGNLAYFEITGGLNTPLGTLRFNGNPVTASTQVTATQLGLLTFDPNGTGTGRVVLTYRAVDTKGLASAATTYTIPVSAANTISGIVYEDVNYGGGVGRSQAASGGVGRSGATVELYNSGGTFVATQNTGGDGSYSFANPGAGTYTVRVVSGTVSSGRGSGGVAVQTYAGNDNQRVGGEAPEKVDAPARTNQTLSGLDNNAVTPNVTAQSRASVTLASGGAATADFGFSFAVVVNTNNDGQGSLRQFIRNANALSNAAAVFDQRPFLDATGQALGTDFPAGQETSIFMIADGTARPGLRAGLVNQLRDAANAAATANSRALLTVTATALPPVTGAGTAIDGTTQTTLSDSNPLRLGSGGTVGLDRVALALVDGPEVELASGVAGALLEFTADDCVLRGLALHGATNAVAVNNGTTAGATTDNMVIEQNLIGTTAFALALPASQPTGNYALQLLNPTGTVRNNFIGYAGNSGINYSAGAGSAGYVIQGNELTQNGMTAAGGDAISVGDTGMAGPLLIENNLISLSNSSGLQFDIGQVSNNTVRNNTIRDNGEGGLSSSRLEGSGIHYLSRRDGRTSANQDLIERNVITSNQSSGIVINSSQRQVRLSRNAIYDNGSRTDPGARGLISVDLTSGPNDGVGGNVNYGQGDGVTPNDGLVNNAVANGGMDYPVITNISLTAGGLLRVQGYIGASAAGNSLFGGATVEIFSANNVDANQNGPTTTTSNDNVPHGEAQTYIGTLTAAADGTFDATLPGVAATINPGDNITATAYLPAYGTSEAGVNQVSNFTVLPVELVAFAATATGFDAQLSWTTAQEKNSAYFAVERSADGVTYEPVARVNGQGTSTRRTTYRWTDAHAARHSQLLYYRLRQVDLDGTAALSAVRTVRYPAAPAVTLSPNPATEAVYLNLAALPAACHVTVTDMAGRHLLTQAAAPDVHVPVSIGSLQPGVYLLTVQSGAHPPVTLRFIKQD